MVVKGSPVSIPDEILMKKIYNIRGRNVMLDQDLAELYDVKTKRLNEQVKRNISRFPDDFLFQLNKEEFNDLKSQFATSSWGGRRTPPVAFTDYGVLMLSSVLNSDRAIKVNIQIIRIFIKMREMMLAHKDVVAQLEQMQNKLAEHDNNIFLILDFIKQLEKEKQYHIEQQDRKKIGYKRHDD